MNRKENTIWYGYLEAGQKSTPVVLDPRLHTGNEETIYLFNLARGEILEYQRQIVEAKLRGLEPEQTTLLKQLKKAYGEARRHFKSRGSRVLHFPEPNAPGEFDEPLENKPPEESGEFVETGNETFIENEAWFDEKQ